jgi:hypothetical protein
MIARIAPANPPKTEPTDRRERGFGMSRSVLISAES